MNRAIAQARGDYVALCGADDVWAPQKLAWQEQAIVAHPEVDVFFGHATAFGAAAGDLARPTGEGVLEQSALCDDLVRCQVIATPFIVMRRSLFDRVGWFEENFKGDDYDYWFRCLRQGVRFYYDPRLLGSYRRHAGNLTNDAIGLWQAMNVVRERDADLIAALTAEPRLYGQVLATDHFRIARMLGEAGRIDEARDEFRAALRHGRDAPATAARALAWLAILGLPAGLRDASGAVLVAVSRGLDSLLGRERVFTP